MRVVERICLFLALAACIFLLLERFEVLDLRPEPDAAEEETLKMELRKAILSDLTTETRLQSAALETRLAGGLEKKLVEEIQPALKQTLKEEISAELKASAPAMPSTLTATELKITNKDGKVVLHLGSTESGGGALTVNRDDGRRVARLYARNDHDGELDLYDEASVIRTNIGANDAGGYANFWSRSGEMAVYVGADSEEDAGYISLYGANKKKAIELIAKSKGGLISVRNLENDKRVAAIGVAPDTGTGLVALARPDGTPGVAIFCTENGGQMKVLNADKKTAAFLGVSADPAGNGLMYVCNVTGQRIIEAGSTAGHGGYMSVRNSKDKRILFMGASTGTEAGDGVIEVETREAKLGVVLRAYKKASSVRVYDAQGKVVKQLR